MKDCPAVPGYTSIHTPVYIIKIVKKAATKSMNLNSSMLPAAALLHHLILILQQLNLGALCNNQRIILSALQPLILGYCYILVTDHIAEHSVVLDNAFLHDNAVLNLDTLANLYITEQDTVLYLSADFTAVGNQAVHHPGGILVLNRSGILGLGVDEVGTHEHLSPDFRIQHILVGIEVCHGGIDSGNISLVLAGKDAVLVHVADDAIQQEIRTAPLKAIGHNLDEGIL